MENSNVIDLTKISEVSKNGRIIPTKSANEVIDYLHPFWEKAKNIEEKNSIVILAAGLCPILMKVKKTPKEGVLNMIYKEKAKFVMEMYGLVIHESK